MLTIIISIHNVLDSTDDLLTKFVESCMFYISNISKFTLKDRNIVADTQKIL